MIEKLWLSRRDWKHNKNTWMCTHFTQIDMEEMSNVIEKLSKAATLCAKELEHNPVSRMFKIEIEDFKGMNALL
jgi:dynein heavy chain